ncbi:MAG: HD domain-containing phosphohydrolase [Capsulimonadaceae bacterium]|nr:HD domain-containing phosphohydrolase [Capsulimonadaceae bacterium]
MTITFEQAVDIAAIAIVVLAFFVAFIYPPLMMRRAIKQSCIALARAVESREPYQLGHSERTAELVVAMARRSVRFAPWQIWDLEIAALLHMIGKVGVAHGTLNSELPPAGRELFALHEYVRIGAEILAAVPPLSGAAVTVAYHREYLDGAGYPFGRYGDGIPFGARLLCVATEFVAMTSPRVYRADGAVMDTADALEYFSQRAGQVYDAEAVELLARICQTPRRPAKKVFSPLADRLRTTS